MESYVGPQLSKRPGLRDTGGLEWVSGRLTSDAKLGTDRQGRAFKTGAQEKKQGPVSEVFRPLATRGEAEATRTASSPVTQPRPRRTRQLAQLIIHVICLERSEWLEI